MVLPVCSPSGNSLISLPEILVCPIKTVDPAALQVVKHTSSSAYLSFASVFSLLLLATLSRFRSVHKFLSVILPFNLINFYNGLQAHLFQRISFFRKSSPSFYSSTISRQMDEVIGSTANFSSTPTMKENGIIEIEDATLVTASTEENTAKEIHYQKKKRKKRLRGTLVAFSCVCVFLRSD